MANWEDLPDVAPAKSGSWEDMPDVSPEKLKAADDQSVRDIVETARKAAPAPKSRWQLLQDALTPSPDTKDMINHVSQEYVEPIARGANQGATFKFGDELKGADAVLSAIGGHDPEKSVNGRTYKPGESIPSYDQKPLNSLSDYADAIKSLPDIYTRVRDADRSANKAAEARSPYLYGGSELAGSLAMPLPGAGAKTAWEAAKIGAKVGAPLAIATGIGGDEKPLSQTSPVEVGLNGLSGATLGGLGGAGGEKLSQFLSGLAARKAAIAAGAKSDQISNQLRAMGVTSQDDLEKFGREMLNEGLIPLSGSKQTVLNRANALQDETGSRVGADHVSSDAAAHAGSASSFDWARMGAASDKPLTVGIAPGEITTVAAAQSGKARKLAESLEEMGKVPGAGFQAANKAKSDAWRSADFRDDPEMSAQLYSDVNRAARDNIQEQLQESFEQRALSMGYSPARAKDIAEKRIAEYQEAARRYGVGAKAEELAKESMSRGASRALLSPTALALTAGALSGGYAHGGAGEAAMTGIPMALLTQILKERGWGAGSRGADLMSKVVPSVAQRAGPLAVGDQRPWQSLSQPSEEDKKTE